MKLSNETKVGLLAIVAIVVLVLGFNFLKGKNIFSKPPTLYAKFADIGSLEKSNMVKINGLSVGTVYNVIQADKEVDNIVVEIHLTRDVLIPKNSIAFIDGSVLGSAYINIDKPAAPAKTYLESGDTISTRLEPSLMSNIQSQLAPTITRVNETLDSLKIAIGGLNNIFDPHTKNNLQDLIANLTVSSAQLQQLLNAQSGMLAKSLANVNEITGNLARNNEAITSSIRNVETATSKFAKVDIEGTMTSLQGTVTELRNTIANLNSKNGSIGLLMNDRELYDRLNRVSERLNSTALSAEITLDDLRLHPKRYVNFSVFGSKNKGQPLSSPLVKDTIPVSEK
jgi:phospholipid/cholesterol/gamma-HCH transport system substrate-binding protein